MLLYIPDYQIDTMVQGKPALHVFLHPPYHAENDIYTKWTASKYLDEDAARMNLFVVRN